MGKIDNWIIEIFDKGTTLIQKKGWIPLNTLIMGVSCLFWSLLIVDSKGPAFYVLSALGGLSLTGEYFTWKNAIGYWENQRKTLELNARVLLMRESSPALRLTSLIIFLPLSICEFILGSYISCASSLIIIVMGYIRCCRYMGPGDYARERQTKMSGLLQESR